MGNVDIRWIQRFSHFQKALGQLESSAELSRQRSLSDLEKQGIIKAFRTSWGQVYIVVLSTNGENLRDVRSQSALQYAIGVCLLRRLNERRKTQHSHYSI